MTESNKENRIVVVDEMGETRIKTQEEIEKENLELENVLQIKPQLDLEILKKLKEKKEESMKAVAKKEVSLNFGIVGLGQAGGRISEKFYKLGYETVIFNTAQQDLEYIDVPKNRKILLPFGLGGAGKSLANGKQAAENNFELISEKISEFITDKQEVLLLITSGGGGTGAGGIGTVINVIKATSSLSNKPIAVIYILPLVSDDALSKHNAVSTLAELTEMLGVEIIDSLIIVDNSKIELLYPNLSKAEFWDVSNSAICETLHMFNKLSNLPTKYDSLDSMDFSRILLSNGILIYGSMEVENFIETTAIAEAVINNLEMGILADGFDLEQTRIGGFLVIGSPNSLKKLPSANILYANHMISDKTGHPVIIQGVYEENIPDDYIMVYTMLGGLGIPFSRIENLKNEAQDKMENIKEKDRDIKNNLKIDYNKGNNTQSKVQEVQNLIKQKSSGFGKLTQNAENKIKDRRKR